MGDYVLSQEKNLTKLKNEIKPKLSNITEKEINEFMSLSSDQYVAMPGNEKTLSVVTTGTPIITGTINDLIVDSQIKSLAIALSLITLTFMIIMKSFVFGILSIIPLAMQTLI
jgi:predicted RND superfamily exporter protein